MAVTGYQTVVSWSKVMSEAHGKVETSRCCYVWLRSSGRWYYVRSSNYAIKGSGRSGCLWLVSSTVKSSVGTALNNDSSAGSRNVGSNRKYGSGCVRRQIDVSQGGRMSPFSGVSAVGLEFLFNQNVYQTQKMEEIKKSVLLARVDQRLVHGIVFNQWSAVVQPKRYME